MNAALANIIFGNETIYFLEKDKPKNSVGEIANNEVEAVISVAENIAFIEKPLEVSVPKAEVEAEEKSEERVTEKLEEKTILEPALATTPPPQVSPTTQTELVDLVVIVRTFSAEEKEFLSKILTSVGRNITEIQVIDLETLGKTNIKAVIVGTKAVFSFGVPFTSLGFKSDLPAYILKMAQEKHYLYADDLQTIQANSNNEKRNLWGALKNIL
jgi:hypothetical protein